MIPRKKVLVLVLGDMIELFERSSQVRSCVHKLHTPVDPSKRARGKRDVYEAVAHVCCKSMYSKPLTGPHNWTLTMVGTGAFSKCMQASDRRAAR
jgi:hypothetical protein